MTTGGDFRGRRGFGHTQDRRQLVPEEAELIRDAAQRVLEGETLVSIVNGWNDRQVTTTTGGPWRINALSSLLIQPRLAGIDSGRADVGAVPLPAILDRATHDRLLALRRSRAKEAGARAGRAAQRRYLLTGFLRCWRCGGRLGGTARATTTRRPSYRCPSRGAGGCSGVVVPADRTDAAALEAVLARIDGPEFEASVESSMQHLAQEEQRVAALLTAAVVGGPGSDGGPRLWTESRQIDETAWRRLRSELEARARGSELAVHAVLADQRRLAGSGARLRRAWDAMGLQERRSLIGAVVDHFVVLPARGPDGAPATDRLRPVWRG